MNIPTTFTVTLTQAQASTLSIALLHYSAHESASMDDIVDAGKAIAVDRWRRIDAPTVDRPIVVTAGLIHECLQAGRPISAIIQLRNHVGGRFSLSQLRAWVEQHKGASVDEIAADLDAWLRTEIKS